MKSIQTKIITIVLGGLMSMALLIGGVGIYTVYKCINGDAVIMMNSTCEENITYLDSQLQMVEEAVASIYEYACAEMPKVSRLEKDEEKRDAYLQKVRKMAIPISNYTKGSAAVYYRLAPELTGNDGKIGFFWQRDSDGQFRKADPTDINAYDREDVEHVGWYYQPVEVGDSIWMEPYYNRNIGMEMISFVIPVYREDRLIGVIGMDIDFQIFVENAQKNVIYKNGRGNLICMEHRKIYSLGEDKKIRKLKMEKELYNNLQKSESSKGYLDTYRMGKESFRMAFGTLSNGMKYMLYAPKTDINAAGDRLLVAMALIMGVVLLIYIFLTVGLVRGIVRPLKELSSAAEQIARGDWNVEISDDKKGDLHVLTDRFNEMTQNVKEQVLELNDLAYKDALTGVKNRTYYLGYIQNLAYTMRSEDLLFAVGVFDVNRLKETNDNYGHGSGDRLIICASQLICRIFDHSPVFRVGGDEFVVIMQGQDYRNRNRLFERFEEEMQKEIVAGTDGEPLSVAYGIAEYPGDGDSYQETFALADERMYDNKRKTKAKRKEE